MGQITFFSGINALHVLGFAANFFKFQIKIKKANRSLAIF
jgi:hypothetical protein